MNRYLIHEGGQPVYLDDMRFIQDAVAESLKGVLDGLTYFDSYEHYDGNVVLSGSVTSGETSDGNTYYDVSEGYVSINHEVYPIKPGRIVVPQRANVYWVVKTESYQNETQANNTEVMVYERRFVQLSETHEEGEEYVQYSGKKLIDLLLGKVENYMTSKVVNRSFKATVTGPMAGKCSYGLQYIKLRSGVEYIYLSFDTGDTKSLELEEVGGKRRLMTFIPDKFLYLSGTFEYLRHNILPGGIYQAHIREGSIYITDTEGNPVTAFPEIGSFSLSIPFA